MNADTRRNTWTRVISLIAVGVGAPTLKEGGAVLFSDGAARAAAGDYVPFVLWFNFIAGFVHRLVDLGHSPSAGTSSGETPGRPRKNW